MLMVHKVEVHQKYLNNNLFHSLFPQQAIRLCLESIYLSNYRLMGVRGVCVCVHVVCVCVCVCVCVWCGWVGEGCVRVRVHVCVCVGINWCV